MRTFVTCSMAAVLACVGCGRVGFGEVRTSDADVDALVTLALPTGDLSNDGGFAYLVTAPVGGFGSVADATDQFTRSTLRLFEDGVELGPAHAVHQDIRDFGLGRFSHWTENTVIRDTVRFSATDNSDPATNGRFYSYLP